MKSSLEITPAAREEIRDILNREKGSPLIRIMPAGGCAACRLGMLFDSVRKDDATFNVEGIRFVVNRDLLRRLQSITIGYAPSPEGAGFVISSEQEMQFHIP